jgi:hypothetical protein
MYCCNEELTARRNGKIPGPQAWNHEVIRALQHAYTLSQSRHESNCEKEELTHDDWIGSEQAAEILGWNVRKVQRHHRDLDGRKLGRAMRFRESVVREYLKEMNHGRTVA